MDENDFIEIESSPEEEILDKLKHQGLIPKEKTLSDLTSAEKSILDIELKRQEKKSHPLENFVAIRNEYLEFTKQRRITKVSDFYDNRQGGHKDGR